MKAITALILFFSISSYSQTFDLERKESEVCKIPYFGYRKLENKKTCYIVSREMHLDIVKSATIANRLSENPSLVLNYKDSLAALNAKNLDPRIINFVNQTFKKMIIQNFACQETPSENKPCVFELIFETKRGISKHLFADGTFKINERTRGLMINEFSDSRPAENPIAKEYLSTLSAIVLDFILQEIIFSPPTEVQGFVEEFERLYNQEQERTPAPIIRIPNDLSARS